MSLFRKPKKTIQRRVFGGKDDEDTEEEAAADAQEEPPPPPHISKEARKKPKQQQPQQQPRKQQALLSFETEDEGEVFQVKKSSHSKKMMRLYEKERHVRKKEARAAAAAAAAEKEELKVREKTEIVTDDLVLVVKNPSHKVPTPPPPILSGRDALCAGRDDMSDEEDEESTPPAMHRFSKPDNFKRVLESGAIPDAAMIHAARKRRQRARELGGDYVPLEEEEPEDNGRLLREDDNEGSDEERIDMDANPVMRDQERRREQFLAAQESDHEIDEWEDQQIRKGVTGAVIQQELLMYNSEYQTSFAPQQQQQAAAAVMPVMDPQIPRTPQAIVDKLKEHYKNVCDSLEANERKLENTDDDLIETARELQELQKKAPLAAERFRFYQELRGYITDLVECLDEKVELITSLEQRAMDFLAHKAEWLVERRRQDVRDQAEELTNLSKGVQMQNRGAEDEEKIRRAAEREGRRSRRRRAREAPGQPKHVEGMSSDDEVPQQDTLTFEKEREQIENDAQQVFDDVIADYSSIANILIKFEQWRETDMAAYQEAYATLCLPRVVSPLVRLNLIFWDPLTESTSDLEKLDWYRTLALYGLHDDETEASLASDPDINLLPVIIEKIIVPKLTLLVDRCWDPLSTSQTLRLVGVVSRYIRRFPSLGPGSKLLNNLFNAISHKLKRALENDIFIPITPKISESKSPFFQRQFASGLKLLRNITSWQGILNDNALKDLALNALLNRYLLSAIKICHLTDAVAKVGLVSLILPRVWLQGGNTPQLQMFSNCVTNLAQQLDKDNPLHLESMETISNIIKSLRT